MSVPKQKHTQGRRDRRRANIKIVAKKMVACSHCKKKIVQHVMCSYCGYYKGKKVKEIAIKKSKKKNAK